jgi:hypothetical protein
MEIKNCRIIKMSKLKVSFNKSWWQTCKRNLGGKTAQEK